LKPWRARSGGARAHGDGRFVRRRRVPTCAGRTHWISPTTPRRRAIPDWPAVITFRKIQPRPSGRPRKSVNCIRLFRLRDIFSSSTPHRVPRVALSRVPAPPFTRWPGRGFSAAWPPSRRASRATARAPRPSPRRRARSRSSPAPRSPASLRRSARVGGTPAAALTSRRLSRRLFPRSRIV